MDSREHQYDLLTAALIGLAIGAGTALMFRRGPKGYRPITPALRAAGRGAKWAGVKGLEGARWAGTKGARGAARGARWAADEAEELWDKVPREEIKDRVEDYLETAYDAINDTVESELSDLRKAIRKQRKRLGV
jgi:hypothetical protein